MPLHPGRHLFFVLKSSPLGKVWMGPCVKALSFGEAAYPVGRSLREMRTILAGLCYLYN